MPTYEYHCDHCRRNFEEFQSITEPPLDKCPLCGTKGEVRRLISSGAGLLFKGPGFYITDYRSKEYKKAAEAEKSGSNSSTTESKKAVETKSAK